MRAVVVETLEERKQRLVRDRAGREFRSEKRQRTRGGAREDVESANIFRELGIDFLSTPRDRVFKLVPERCEGRKVSSFSERSLEFLRENYDVEQVVDDSGRHLLHFKIGGTKSMSIISDVAERTELTGKQVKKVYEAFLEVVQQGLKEERKVRLPGLGQFGIKYRPAKPKRKGRNPFSGKEMWFKAKSASNKLRFRPSKDLKTFVADEIAVVEPKHKKKRKKNEK